MSESKRGGEGCTHIKTINFAVIYLNLNVATMHAAAAAGVAQEQAQALGESLYACLPALLFK